jgi:hypothetical protein
MPWPTGDGTFEITIVVGVLPAAVTVNGTGIAKDAAYVESPE